MPAVTVRDVPEETRNELAARAARTGRSLREFLRQALIDMASRPDMDELLNEVRRRKEATGSRLPADVIVSSLDVDRR